LLRFTLADARQRRTFAADAAQRSRHALLTTAKEQRAVSIKRIVIRTFQVVLATSSLLAGFHALASGGKTAGSAWSQHLLEALLIIAVLEWVLQHDWSEPAVRGLTEQEWKKVHEEARQQEEFEQYVEQHVLMPRPHE
jgi:hypothetical protein